MKLELYEDYFSSEMSPTTTVWPCASLEYLDHHRNHECGEEGKMEVSPCRQTSLQCRSPSSSTNLTYAANTRQLAGAVPLSRGEFISVLQMYINLHNARTSRARGVGKVECWAAISYTWKNIGDSTRRIGIGVLNWPQTVLHAFDTDTWAKNDGMHYTTTPCPAEYYR